MSVIRRRHLPTEVDTVQWLGDNEAEVQEFTGPGVFRAIPAAERVSTPEITASVCDRLHATWIGVYTGQHIVRGIEGELYPIAEDVLGRTYEPAETSADFFQPGHTYTDGTGYTAPEITTYFLVEHVTRHPDRGHLRAIGWMRSGEPGAGWHGDFRDEDEFDGWTDVTEAGDVR